MSSSGILIAGVFIKNITLKKSGSSREWCCKGSGYLNKLMGLLNCALIGKRNAGKMRSKPKTIKVQLPMSGTKKNASKLNCKHLRIIAGVEAAFRIKQLYNIKRSYFIPSFWVKEPLRFVQAFC